MRKWKNGNDKIRKKRKTGEAECRWKTSEAGKR